jgi:hypothetical protein
LIRLPPSISRYEAARTNGASGLFSGREPTLLFEQPVGHFDIPDHRFLAGVCAISYAIVEILGPMFWAALFVLFIEAEISAG